MVIVDNIKNGFSKAGCWIKEHSKQIIVGTCAIGGSLLALGLAGTLKCDDDDCYSEIDLDDPEVDVTVVEVETESEE